MPNHRNYWCNECGAAFVPDKNNQDYCDVCIIKLERRIDKMTNQTIKEAANTYVPRSAKNITELKSVSVDLLIQEETGKDVTGEEYSYNYIEVNGEKFRIPDSVLKDLKAILQKKSNLKTFSVSKSGEGRNTKYTVIPLD